jgi:GT2 family glycosyltransferase
MSWESTIKNPSVAVIMLNWNTPEMTISAINSVLQSDYPEYSVHVTDNGSKDKSYEILKKEYGGKIYLYKTEKNIGYAGGMSYCLAQGIKMNPHYFLIMNNDTIIDKNAITSLVETAKRHHDNCVVTGKVYFYDEKDVLQTVGNEFNRVKMTEKRIGYKEKDLGQYDEETERGMIDDIFMLLPATIYIKVGGYSKYFFLNYEQTDLILRIKDKGYKAIYTPNAKLWHKGSFSSGGLGNSYMMFWEGKSSLIIHYLYQSGFNFLMFYLNYFSTIFWSMLKGILKKILFKDSVLKPRIAKVHGFLSGTFWIFSRKPETGYNPYAKK